MQQSTENRIHVDNEFRYTTNLLPYEMKGELRIVDHSRYNTIMIAGTSILSRN